MNNFNWSFDIVYNSRNSDREACAWGANPRGGMVIGDYGDDFDEDDEESDEEEEEDRSLDLLIRFVENVFRKVSRKARKAVKSVLPVPISTRLVGFAVNGTILLTFLWVLKAFLQVICTLGSVVFASILLIRGIWSGISFFQDGRGYNRADDDDEAQSWFCFTIIILLWSISSMALFCHNTLIIRQYLAGVHGSVTCLL